MSDSTNTAAARSLRTPARTLLGCIGFVVTAVVVLFGLDRVMGHRNAGRQWAGLIGAEVYRVANDRSLRNDRDAHTVYLGDSVALQMFWPGHETRPDVRYLTTNQAIGVAGQYYILRNATAHFPNLRQVVLMYTPNSWTNDLRPPLANDYFCEFFHSPDEIAELFRVKRDPQLAVSQISRWLLPNLMAANSASSLGLYSEDRLAMLHPKPAWRRADTQQAAASPQTEPLLQYAGQLSLSVSQSPLPAPNDRAGIINVSPLSAYFLDRIRSWCAGHQLTLRVLPCPCISTRVFAAAPTPFDAPLWYLPESYFRDDIHFVKEKVDPVREQFVKRFELNRN